MPAFQNSIFLQPISFMWSAVVSIIYVGLSGFAAYKFWTKREEMAFKQRNPRLMMISSVGLILDSVVQWSRLVSPSPLTLCHASYFTALSLFSLVALPLTLRGFQFLVLTNDSYRRKTPQFRSNKFILRVCAIFLIFHTLLIEIFYGVFHFQKGHCSINWDGVYVSVLSIIVIYMTYKLSSLIPWRFDSYNIGRELKICYLIWTIYGGISISYSLTMENFTCVPWQLQPFISILMNFSIFYVTIVLPLLNTTRKKTDEVSVQIKEIILPYHSHTPHQNKIFYPHKIFPFPEEQHQHQRFNINPPKTIHKMKKNALLERVLEEKEPANEQVHAPNDMEQTDDLQQKLYSLFYNDAAVKLLHDYAKRKVVPEITMFLHCVHLYKAGKKLCTESSELFDQFQYIVTEFIEPGAPYEINISSKIRGDILGFGSCLNDFNEHDKGEQLLVFDTAFQETCDLFKRNFGQELHNFSLLMSNLNISDT